MPSVVVIAAVALASSAPLAWWAVSTGRASQSALRNLHLGLEQVPDVRRAALDAPAGERALRPVVEAGARVARRITPAGMVDATRERVQLAGQPAGWPVERVLAAKVVLSLVVGALTAVSAVGSPSVFALLLLLSGTAGAFMLPDILLVLRGSHRQEGIRAELPDVLDQLTISVEAGLGFESALARAASGDGHLAGELHRTLQDMQLGTPTADALRNLTDRTDVAELRHFVTAVLQAAKHGIPIARVLRVQAAELRIKRSQRAEERAMKVPVKVLFPLLFCILPALFVVIIGPAIVRISGSSFGG